MCGKLHLDNPYYTMFHKTMHTIAVAADSDWNKGREVLQKIRLIQDRGSDEDELKVAWDEWYDKVPSAAKVRDNKKKHAKEIASREYAIMVVAGRNPSEDFDIINKVQMACDRLIKLYLEGFVPMPDNSYSWLGEGHVF